jgi:hypothetical protein
MAYTEDSKSSIERYESSSLSSGTIFMKAKFITADGFFGEREVPFPPPPRMYTALYYPFTISPAFVPLEPPNSNPKREYELYSYEYGVTEKIALYRESRRNLMVK